MFKFNRTHPNTAQQNIRYRKMQEYLYNQLHYAATNGVQRTEIFTNIFNSMQAYKTAFRITEQHDLERLVQSSIERLKIIAKRGGITL